MRKKRRKKQQHRRKSVFKQGIRRTASRYIKHIENCKDLNGLLILPNSSINTDIVKQSIFHLFLAADNTKLNTH